MLNDTNLEVLLPAFLFGHDLLDGDAKEHGIDGPLSEGPRGEAPVTARLLEQAEADKNVEAVVSAHAKCHAVDLGQKAQVGE